MRAQLDAELAERTANASQLEQACARLTAERLEERMAHEADKGALEVALEHERARLSLSPMLESLRSQADEAQAEAAALKAQAEARRLAAEAPCWMRWGRFFWMLQHRFRKLISGGYKSYTFDYEIYTNSAAQRQTFHAKHLRTFWPKRIMNF